MNYGKYIPYVDRKEVMRLESEVDTFFVNTIELRRDLTYQEKHELFDLFLSERAAASSIVRGELEDAKETISSLENRLEYTEEEVEERDHEISELKDIIEKKKRHETGLILEHIAQIDIMEYRINHLNIKLKKRPTPVPEWVYYAVPALAGYLLYDVVQFVINLF